jgi:4-amino-4-deoxy-L-arabinose transferase-like glycosyltransferase
VISSATNWALRHPALCLGIIATLIILARVVTLASTPLNLGPDEAQYWSWSLYPSAGYFSKPPFIAWLIGAATSACGTSEFCIRLPSPLAHAATGFILFLAGRRLYDERVGFWSALTYWLMPGTSFSSLLITTDVPLLFFWSLALWSIAEMRVSRSPVWTILLGTSVGLGLLSKYAMAYFALGLLVAALWGNDNRSMLRDRRFAVATLIAALVVAPNIIWNIDNSLATVRHTAANANWNASDLFNPGKALGFLAAQVGIIGPIAAGIVVWGATKALRSSGIPATDRLLLALSIPILAVVTCQAFISRAHANWAAPAFIALTVLACAWACRSTARWPLIANTSVNGVIALLLCAMAASPAVVAALGQENAVKRLRGWPEAGSTIMGIASSAPFTAILSDDREDIASLSYYTRQRQTPLRMWPSPTPSNEFEARHALTADLSRYVLLVTRRSDVRHITDAFTSAERIGKIETRLDQKRTRTFFLFALTGPVTASTFPSLSDNPSTDE